MDNIDTLHGIQDLIPLATPPGHGSTLWLGALLLTLASLAGWWLWTRLQSPRSRARRQLRKMQRQPGPNSDSAAHARQLASTFASGIGSRHLGSRTPLPTALQDQLPRWQDFITQLSRACYGSQAQPDQLTALGTEAHYWLRQWPTGTTQR